MALDVGDLGPGERSFVDAVAELVDRPPSVILDALLTPPEAPGLVATRVVDGRFTHLSLRAFGPRLRWASGERGLELPLGGLDHLQELDVSELELDALDVSELWRLTRLECSGNRLKRLDVEGTPGLAALSCAANDLMVLDLRHLHDLWFCDCSGNALTAVIVPEGRGLRTLRCSRNQLMVLELGSQPDLTELSCSRNALVRLVADAPRLRVLDAGDNQLVEVDVARFPALQRLDVGRNRLGSLSVDGCPQLRELDCARNYLDRLALRSLDRLETVDVSRNQLERLDLGRCPALVRLDCGTNHLRSLDVADCPSLLTLVCPSNSLTALALEGCPALCELRADDNALTSMDVAATPRLARLTLSGNPLTSVDLTGARISHLELEPGPDVHATPLQAALLTPLRVAAGLPVGGRDLAGLDRFGVHALATRYDEPDREARFLEVVRDPERCARGTALMLYWMAAPHYYLQFEVREEVPRYALPGWDLIEAVEERVRADAYVHDDIPFDPRDDQQTTDPRGRDWTRDAAAEGSREGRRRTIPAFMMRASGP